jgi:hypothetical protein
MNIAATSTVRLAGVRSGIFVGWHMYRVSQFGAHEPQTQRQGLRYEFFFSPNGSTPAIILRRALLAGVRGRRSRIRGDCAVDNKG